MVPLGDGYCEKGYYAGWDKKAVMRQEDCNMLCLNDPECAYAAFLDKWTCSRYNGETCNLNCGPGSRNDCKNHKTFKKTIQKITS